MIGSMLNSFIMQILLHHSGVLAWYYSMYSMHIQWFKTPDKLTDAANTMPHPKSLLNVKYVASGTFYCLFDKYTVPIYISENLKYQPNLMKFFLLFYILSENLLTHMISFV